MYRRRGEEKDKQKKVIGMKLKMVALVASRSPEGQYLPYKQLKRKLEELSARSRPLSYCPQPPYRARALMAPCSLLTCELLSLTAPHKPDEDIASEPDVSTGPVAVPESFWSNEVEMDVDYSVCEVASFR